ncbi:ABC transporter permease DevC [Rhodoplanes sp. Z2-YC6860]|uniref:ABC transporter permease DevC n=1 Tax=Rhodoplanes sp. Z2-YC6860 TaxID=674703 RepID=UPI00078C562F|nr:ABC transporter permease DevC [Rhodoplanes sp. Z2-YC6860]AMN45467.1 DevC-like ABC transporter permease [Rhodoplanes sp. Z2-YC6860]
MKLRVAWRMLVHEKGRAALAVGGVFVAILLIFLQLGFYLSVPRGGLLFYNAMRFDLLLTSSAYVIQAQSNDFPRRRLYQALAVPEVATAAAVYHDSGLWLNAETGVQRDVFVIAFDPNNRVFDVPEIEQKASVLRQQDTILVDGASRPELGALRVGRRIEIAKRAVTIGGVYRLGIGFVGLGVVLTSDLNLIRLFPNRNLGDINLGLLTLRPGADPDAVAEKLRQILPEDTAVLTRKELAARETDHWMTRTSTGLIFGFGTIVAFIVGLVILNQTLSTQIARHLPQYATLKAIGYTDAALAGIVVTLAILIATLSYLPAALISTGIYALVSAFTPLPVSQTPSRLLTVLAVTWVMSTISALIAIRVLRRADPVELF